MGRKKYNTEEEKKAAKKEYNKRYQQEHKEEIAEKKKQYRQEHKEEIAEYAKQYYQDNKEKKTEYYRQYRQTPFGRACCLLQTYKRSDKKYDRGECTLTAEWIMENIFTQKCHWCPETDWSKIGCDRIDNELPHTPDNVIPCCERCNKDRGRKTYETFKKALRAEETVL